MVNSKQNNPIVLDFQVAANSETDTSEILAVMHNRFLPGVSSCPLPFTEGGVWDLESWSEVEKEICPALTDSLAKLPLRSYSAANRRPSVGQRFKNIDFNRLWVDLQTAWLACDLAMRCESTPFYTERKHSTLRPAAYSDTFPSSVIVFGSTSLVTTPQNWSKFHQGYLTLAELRIGVMWEYRLDKSGKKSVVSPRDTEVLEKVVMAAPAIFNSAKLLFADEGFKESVESAKLFCKYLADELTAIAVVNNDSLNGNWRFYAINDRFLAPRVWKILPRNFEVDM